ncbi:MAG: nucleotide pyrophosphohydrolase [Planctomycetota bacterium]
MPDSPTPPPAVRTADGIADFQRRIEQIYFARDSQRGVPGTYMWFVEEVGELARSLLSGAPGSAAEAAEFADCLAWLSSLASLRGIDLSAAAWNKYRDGCPRCRVAPCCCQHRIAQK